MDLEKLTIGQMAELNHVSEQTLRLYDREGLMKPRYTDPVTGYRYYHITQSARLDMIQTMKVYGMTLRQIRAALSNSDAQALVSLLLEQASQLQSLSESSNKQLIWIAAISLVVGGIGVMNIMLVSVTERTREIGLKIAIGAQQSRIRWQFLTEAAVLTSMGGILGVGCGIGLAEMMSHVMSTPVAISVPACIIAVAFSMCIGVVFGFVPAVKASKLNPIEALRRE